MGHYAYELKEATSFINKKDFNTVLEKIKEEVKTPKWSCYGWRNSVLKAETLEDFAKEFNIQLVEEENDNYRPEINDVYVSNFFRYLIEIIAPYMTNGEININDEYDDVLIVFENGISNVYRL